MHSKAEILNDQIKSVFPKQDHIEETPILNEPRYPNIDDRHISTERVGKLLQNIDLDKASGPDSIPDRILKLCAKELAPAITHIFNHLNIKFEPGNTNSGLEKCKHIADIQERK